MATNDFIDDLVSKLKEDNIEYLVVTVQKGKKDHVGSAYYNITTADGADIIFTTVDTVIDSIIDNEDDDGEDDDGEDDGEERV